MATALKDFCNSHFPPSVGEGSTRIAPWMHTGSDVVVQVIKQTVNPLRGEGITFTKPTRLYTKLVDAIS